MRSTLVCSLAITVAAALAGQVQALFSSAEAGFALYGAGEISGVSSEPSFDFNLKGNPFKLESRQQGLTLSGNAGDGRFTSYVSEGTENKGKKAYFVDRIHVVGNAQVILDSTVADAFLSQTTKKPSTATTQSRTQIDTRLFNYTGTATQGTLELPEATILQNRSQGRQQTKKKKEGKEIQVWETFEQTLKLDGSKGQVMLNPAAKGKEMPLQKGFFDGPVTLTVHRVATEDGSRVPSVSDLNGSCDRIEMDLTATPKTIRMLGHLKLTTSSTVADATFEADEVTFTLSDTLQVVGISADKGKPTTTTIPLKKGGA